MGCLLKSDYLSIDGTQNYTRLLKYKDGFSLLN